MTPGASPGGEPSDGRVRATVVQLRPWGPGDLVVLERSNAPDMMDYLGGPETAEKLADRHTRYLRYWQTGEACMFRINTDESPGGVGVIGFWQTTWKDREVYEAGWSVETRHQGKGIAARALDSLLEFAGGCASAPGGRSLLVAFPRTDNARSNALCERAGLRWECEDDFEYPKGHPIWVNAWVARLRPE